MPKSAKNGQFWPFWPSAETRASKTPDILAPKIKRRRPIGPFLKRDFLKSRFSKCRASWRSKTNKEPLKGPKSPHFTKANPDPLKNRKSSPILENPCVPHSNFLTFLSKSAKNDTFWRQEGLLNKEIRPESFLRPTFCRSKILNGFP